jgi:ubiquinone/menaquinone biosynthesis C-methylase UbiE
MTHHTKFDLTTLVNPCTQSHLREHTTLGSITLEIGCGPGQYRSAIFGSYVGIDTTAKPYKKGVPRTPDIVAEAHYLPFKDGLFNVVFYSGVLQYFHDAHEVVREARRVLKRRGYLLVFDYSKKTLERLDGEYRRISPRWRAHVRSCAEWVQLLQDVGLKRVVLSTNQTRLRDYAYRLFNRRQYFDGIDNREEQIYLRAIG